MKRQQTIKVYTERKFLIKKINSLRDLYDILNSDSIQNISIENSDTLSTLKSEFKEYLHIEENKLKSELAQVQSLKAFLGVMEKLLINDCLDYNEMFYALLKLIPRIDNEQLQYVYEFLKLGTMQSYWEFPIYAYNQALVALSKKSGSVEIIKKIFFDVPALHGFNLKKKCDVSQVACIKDDFQVIQKFVEQFPIPLCINVNFLSTQFLWNELCVIQIKKEIIKPYEISTCLNISENEKKSLNTYLFSEFLENELGILNVLKPMTLKEMQSDSSKNKLEHKNFSDHVEMLAYVNNCMLRCKDYINDINTTFKDLFNSHCAATFAIRFSNLIQNLQLACHCHIDIFNTISLHGMQNGIYDFFEKEEIHQFKLLNEFLSLALMNLNNLLSNKILLGKNERFTYFVEGELDDNYLNLYIIMPLMQLVLKFKNYTKEILSNKNSVFISFQELISNSGLLQKDISNDKELKLARKQFLMGLETFSKNDHTIFNNIKQNPSAIFTIEQGRLLIQNNIAQINNSMQKIVESLSNLNNFRNLRLDVNNIHRFLLSINEQLHFGSNAFRFLNSLRLQTEQSYEELSHLPNFQNSWFNLLSDVQKTQGFLLNTMPCSLIQIALDENTQILLNRDQSLESPLTSDFCASEIKIENTMTTTKLDASAIHDTQKTANKDEGIDINAQSDNVSNIHVNKDNDLNLTESNSDIIIDNRPKNFVESAQQDSMSKNDIEEIISSGQLNNLKNNNGVMKINIKNAAKQNVNKNTSPSQYNIKSSIRRGQTENKQMIDSKSENIGLTIKPPNQSESSRHETSEINFKINKKILGVDYFKDMIAIINVNLEKFNVVNVCTAFSRWSKLWQEASIMDLNHELEDYEDWHYEFVLMKEALSGDVYRLLIKKANGLLSKFQPRDFANLMNSISRLTKTKESEELFNIICRLISKAALEGYKPQHLANLSNALAKVLPDSDIARALMKKIARRILSLESLEGYEPQGLANLSNALAKVLPDSDIARALMKKIAQHILKLNLFEGEGYKPQDFANLSNALAKVLPDSDISRDLMEKIASHINNLESFEGYDQQDLASLSDALAKLNIADKVLLNKIFYWIIKMDIEKFSIEDLSQLYQAYLYSQVMNLDVNAFQNFFSTINAKLKNRISSTTVSSLQKTVYNSIGQICINKEVEIHQEYPAVGSRIDIAIISKKGDFKIAIEVDGPSHFQNNSENISGLNNSSRFKTMLLEKCEKWKVIRLSCEDINQNTNGVKDYLQKELKNLLEGKESLTTELNVSASHDTQKTATKDEEIETSPILAEDDNNTESSSENLVDASMQKVSNILEDSNDAASLPAMNAALVIDAQPKNKGLLNKQGIEAEQKMIDRAFNNLINILKTLAMLDLYDKAFTALNKYKNSINQDHKKTKKGKGVRKFKSTVKLPLFVNEFSEEYDFKKHINCMVNWVNKDEKNLSLDKLENYKEVFEELKKFHIEKVFHDHIQAIFALPYPSENLAYLCAMTNTCMNAIIKHKEKIYSPEKISNVKSQLIYRSYQESCALVNILQSPVNIESYAKENFNVYIYCLKVLVWGMVTVMQSSKEKNIDLAGLSHQKTPLFKSLSDLLINTLKLFTYKKISVPYANLNAELKPFFTKKSFNSITLIEQGKFLMDASHCILRYLENCRKEFLGYDELNKVANYWKSLFLGQIIHEDLIDAKEKIKPPENNPIATKVSVVQKDNTTMKNSASDSDEDEDIPLEINEQIKRKINGIKSFEDLERLLMNDLANFDCENVYRAFLTRHLLWKAATRMTLKTISLENAKGLNQEVYNSLIAKAKELLHQFYFHHLSTILNAIANFTLTNESQELFEAILLLIRNVNFKDFDLRDFEHICTALAAVSPKIDFDRNFIKEIVTYFHTHYEIEDYKPISLPRICMALAILMPEEVISRDYIKRVAEYINTHNFDEFVESFEPKAFLNLCEALVTVLPNQELSRAILEKIRKHINLPSTFADMNPQVLVDFKKQMNRRYNGLTQGLMPQEVKLTTQFETFTGSHSKEFIFKFDIKTYDEVTRPGI